MGIADTLKNQVFDESELPLLLLAESRCFRPEISKSATEAKLYRVHEFNKLEMFAICSPTQSSAILQMFLETQIEIWSKMDVKFKYISFYQYSHNFGVVSEFWICQVKNWELRPRVNMILKRGCLDDKFMVKLVARQIVRITKQEDSELNIVIPLEKKLMFIRVMEPRWLPHER